MKTRLSLLDLSRLFAVSSGPVTVVELEETLPNGYYVCKLSDGGVKVVRFAKEGMSVGSTIKLAATRYIDEIRAVEVTPWGCPPFTIAYSVLKSLNSEELYRAFQHAVIPPSPSDGV